ncbi:hypothetical protein CAEBREN_19605 [Caenorhabditis brenneri]|uniref:Uncharacterized protein n=1 Tax=Caenorhabditis brenneri TaxID=135651 RepID=G0M9C8_CAEBE|nr:hypothetical protein CAEBREN_19605 [Caenorhabditis brenneri]
MLHQLLLLTLFTASDAALSEIIPYQLIMAVPGPGSVFVSGQLMCHGKPYANETVQIFEKNYVFSDNKFAETQTDSEGRFEMQAWIEEYWPLIITPYVYIPNYCDSVMNDDGKRCINSGIQINFRFTMITRSEGAPNKKLIVGPLELSGEPASERLGMGSWLGGWLASEKECRDY